MEGVTQDGNEILMVIVNPSDYAVGTDKGGEISKFDQFDIDVNQYKYLLEGRCSGALVKHQRAQVVLRDGAVTVVVPTVPTFDPSTGELTIPTVTGVKYYRVVIDGPNVLVTGTITVEAGDSVEIEAVSDPGYAFEHNTDEDWVFTADE